jgi:uncharacterized protein with HEPN domain
MSERTDSEFAKDIEEAVRRISSYSNGLTYEAFLNLEIIGEAAKNDPLKRLLDSKALE